VVAVGTHVLCLYVGCSNEYVLKRPEILVLCTSVVLSYAFMPNFVVTVLVLLLVQGMVNIAKNRVYDGCLRILLPDSEAAEPEESTTDSAAQTPSEESGICMPCFEALVD
jgi:hypothetical protein